MATLTATSSAQLQTHMTNAVGGDIIEIASGTYSLVTMTSGLAKASEVIIRPQDRDNPPNFPNRGFALTGATNLTFDGLNFVGTAIERTGADGTTYPLTDRAFVFVGGSNIKIKNCLIRFYRNYQIRMEGTDNVTISYCDFEQMGNDVLFWDQPCDNPWIHHCVWRDARVDPTRINEVGRHADGAQSRMNAGSGPYTNLKVEDCYIEYSGTGQGGKPLYFTIDSSGGGVGYTDTIIRRCLLISGRAHGIFLCGHQGFLIEDVVIRANPGTPDAHIPQISIWNDDNTGIIRRVVQPKGMLYGGPTGGPVGSASGITFTNHVISTTAEPTGWASNEPVPGVNCGRYTDPEEETPPDTPALMTFPEDAFVAGTVEVAEFPGKYTAIIEVPTTSVAYATAALNPNNMSWLPSGETQARGFRAANPATSAAGGLLFELIAGGIEALYCAAPGATISGIQMRYRVNGVYTDWSGAETLSFTAPGTPPDPEVLDPLEADQWEFFGSVTAVSGMAARYTQQLRLIGDAPTVSALQWTEDGASTWADVIEVSAGVYELGPLTAGGREHTVTYDETLSVRLRYSVDVEFGPQSADAKSFTGPAEPPPPPPFEDGDVLTSGGETCLVGGRPMVVAHRTRPDMIGNRDISLARSGDTVTVDGIETPAGAAGVQVVYNGRPFKVNAGRARFTAVVGQDWVYAYAYAADGTPGLMRYFRVPAA